MTCWRMRGIYKREPQPQGVPQTRPGSRCWPGVKPAASPSQPLTLSRFQGPQFTGHRRIRRLALAPGRCSAQQGPAAVILPPRLPSPSGRAPLIRLLPDNPADDQKDH